VPNFVAFTASSTELAGLSPRKIAYSVSRSPSLVDAPGTEACASEYNLQQKSSINDVVAHLRIACVGNIYRIIMTFLLLVNSSSLSGLLCC